MTTIEKVGLASLVGLIVGELFAFNNSESESIEVSPESQKTTSCEVSKHIRNLPDGHHASQAKRDSATEYGITLGEGQTWVESYNKEYRYY